MKIDVPEDEDFNGRYSGFLNLLYILDRYFEKHPERKTFTEKFNINLIKVNEILSDMPSNREMEFFAEILLVLSTISDSKDIFLDRVGDLSDDMINYFLTIIDEYIGSVDKNAKQRRTTMKLSLIARTSNYGEAKEKEKDFKIEILKKEKDELFKQNNDILKLNQELEDINLRLRDDVRTNLQIIEKLQREKEEFVLDRSESKFRDVNNTKNEEDLIKEAIELDRIKSELSRKENEIEEINHNCNLQINKYKEQVSVLTEKLDAMAQKDNDLKNAKNQIEAMKMKINELMISKTKADEYDKMKQLLDNSIHKVETLNKDKSNLQAKFENLKKELEKERDKTKAFNMEKGDLQYNVDELKKEKEKLEKLVVRKQVKNATVKETHHGKKSLQDTSLRIRLTENKSVSIESNDDLLSKLPTNELQEENSNLKREINRLNLHLTDLKIDLANEKEKIAELQKSLHENQEDLKRTSYDKEKIEIENSKFNLEMEKLKFQMDTENKKLEEENLDLNSKLSKLKKEKDRMSKDLEDLKTELQNTNLMIKKLLEEKKNFISNEQKLREELNKEKMNAEKQKNIQNTTQESKAKIENDFFIEQLQKEINILEETLKRRENKISILEDSIKKKDEELKKLIIQIKDNNETYNKELEKRQEDINFLKKSYDDQKVKFNKENDLILTSLYELALQFNTLKNEYDKKSSNMKQF